MRTVIETERLELREFNLNDCDFILELVNSPGWIQFIGDKHISTADEARVYLARGPMESYRKNGFGTLMVQLKKDKTPIGMCGLIKRDTLHDVDLGYALLQAHTGKGYAREAAAAALNYAWQNLKLQRVVAITTPDNRSSIQLLEKLKFSFEKRVVLQDDTDELLLFGIAAQA